LKRFFLLCCLIFFHGSIFAKNISVVTLAAGDGYQQAVQIGLVNKQKYCEKHGYEFVHGDEVLDHSRPIPWSKILLILDVMESSDCDWIFWTDADSMIMNFGIPLEDLIDEDYHFILTEDFTWNPTNLNTGQFLIRNCAESRAFLEKVYARTECINHRWWEQQGIILELEVNPFREKTKILPQRMMNSYSLERNAKTLQTRYQKGDFLIHFAGCHDLKKLQRLFEIYKPKVVNDPNLLTLEKYLGFYGYKTSQSKADAEFYKQHIDRLNRYPSIKTVAVFGAQKGLLLEEILQNVSHLQSVVVFEYKPDVYAQVVNSYYSRKYKEKFAALDIQDTSEGSKYYRQFHKNIERCDLIYIEAEDDAHLLKAQICFSLFFRNAKTILWIDNSHFPSIQQAIEDLEEKGTIEITHRGGVKGKSWVEARFLKK